MGYTSNRHSDFNRCGNNVGVRPTSPVLGVIYWIIPDVWQFQRDESRFFFQGYGFFSRGLPACPRINSWSVMGKCVEMHSVMLRILLE